jgi:hypothetical protein
MRTVIQPARPRISPAVATLSLLIALNLLNYIDRYILPGELSLVKSEFHCHRSPDGRAHHGSIHLLHARRAFVRLAGRPFE